MEKEATLLESGKENKDLCSFYEDELTELYSSCGSDTSGNDDHFRIGSSGRSGVR